MALSFKLLGFNEFAARFPTALFAILDSVLIFLLSYKITNNKL